MNTVAALGGHSDPLQIRKPASSGLVVGMADVIACNWPFAADFTFFCHGKTPYIENVHMIYAKTGYIHVLRILGKLFLKLASLPLY
jgi:hypothetical protein